MSENSWPGDVRRSMTQSEHEQWNASNYPGTREMCSVCDSPTGRCGEDSMWSEAGEPLCEECNKLQGEESQEWFGENGGQLCDMAKGPCSCGAWH